MDDTSQLVRQHVSGDLKQRTQWVTWRYEQRGGKPTKVPYQPNGQHAKTSDPNTWCTFDEALTALEAGQFDGIGFVFTADDPFLGIDLDDCIRPDDSLTEWAADVVARFNGISYMEISPSRKGLKLIVKATKPTNAKSSTRQPDDGKLELWDHGRYFTLTGRVFGANVAIGDAQDAVNGLVADGIIDQVQPQPAWRGPSVINTPDIDQHERIERALAYLSTIEPSISGQRGHDQLIKAARVLRVGFDLSEDVCVQLLMEHFNPHCQPPWSEQDIRRKVREAERTSTMSKGQLLVDKQHPMAVFNQLDSQGKLLPETGSEFWDACRAVVNAHQVQQEWRAKRVSTLMRQASQQGDQGQAINELRQLCDHQSLTDRFTHGINKLRVTSSDTQFWQAAGIESPEVILPSRADGMTNDEMRQPFIIEGLLPYGQNLVIAGGPKTLKTTLMCYLSVCLASRSPVLDHTLTVSVNKQRDRRAELASMYADDPEFQALMLDAHDDDVAAGRVKDRGQWKTLLLTGESGKATIIETLNRICRSAAINIDLAQLGEDVMVSEWIPVLGSSTTDAEWFLIEKLIREQDADVVMIDPIYLCLSDDHASDSDQAQKLKRLESIVKRCGATLVVAHHFKKEQESNQTGRWPTPSMISHGFLPRWQRSYLLINPAKRWHAGQDHELLLVAGSSSGTGFDAYIRIQECPDLVEDPIINDEGNLVGHIGLLKQDGRNRVFEIKEIKTRDEWDRYSDEAKQEAEAGLIDEGAQWLHQLLASEVVAMSMIKKTPGKPDKFGESRIKQVIDDGLASGEFVEVHKHTSDGWKLSHITSREYLLASDRCCADCSSLIHKSEGCQCLKEGSQDA